MSPASPGTPSNGIGLTQNDKESDKLTLNLGAVEAYIPVLGFVKEWEF